MSTHRLRLLALAATLLASLAANAEVLKGPAANFTLIDRNGKAVSLAQFKGEVVMLNFWASWCKPCRQEMPLLEQLYKRYKALGFTLVGVNVDEDSAKGAALLQDVPVTFPVVFDAKSEVSTLYKLQGMPSSIFIDRQGQLRYLHTGYMPGDEQEYDKQVRALIKE